MQTNKIYSFEMFSIKGVTDPATFPFPTANNNNTGLQFI